MGTKKVCLSKSILEMKFMKPTKERVERQQYLEEGEKYFRSLLTKEMEEKSQDIVMESSYAFCQKLINGRISYQGMNPAIESLMEAIENEKRSLSEAKQEADISDEQLTVHWKEMRANLNTGKRHRRSRQKINSEEEPIRKKPRFLKPLD